MNNAGTLSDPDELAIIGDTNTGSMSTPNVYEMDVGEIAVENAADENWYRVPNRKMMRDAKRRVGKRKPLRSRIQRGKSRTAPESDWLGEFRETEPEEAS